MNLSKEKTKQYVVLLVLVSVSGCAEMAVHRDAGSYGYLDDPFLDSLKNKAGYPVSQPDEELVVDWKGIAVPDSPEVFEQVWHNPPVCQDITGNCWAFAATSFLESEVFRLHGEQVKLSELHLVYWEYVEKARRFVQQKGNSRFSRGSMPNAALRIWSQYGVVPSDEYTGLLAGREFYDDRPVFAAMWKRLEEARENKQWDEDGILNDIRTILDQYFGRPPENIRVGNKTMSPRGYVTEILRFKTADYVDVMSLMKESFGHQCSYPVPDNWWGCEAYHNMPLDNFYSLIRKALDEGYSIALGCDRTGPGYSAEKNAAIIPTFDIPLRYIDDCARQLRFDDGVTTDDHAMHLIGQMRMDGYDWFLVKDSETLARNGLHDGYYFFREDYVKLKVMNLMVHRDVLK